MPARKKNMGWWTAQFIHGKADRRLSQPKQDNGAGHVYTKVITMGQRRQKNRRRKEDHPAGQSLKKDHLKVA